MEVVAKNTKNKTEVVCQNFSFGKLQKLLDTAPRRWFQTSSDDPTSTFLDAYGHPSDTLAIQVCEVCELSAPSRWPLLTV